MVDDYVFSAGSCERCSLFALPRSQFIERELWRCAVGSTQAQYETLTNSGQAPITISQVAATGAGFSVNGLSLPMNLNNRQSVTFTVAFAPKASGGVTGGISVVSNASSSALTIALSGNGTN
jgi:hypothetical protein